MRPLYQMDVVQIEVTNACVRTCANCTRMVGHRKPYLMDFEFFMRAVDCTADFPQQVGMMGGEPLLHPNFEVMCKYMAGKIPRERLGLWTTLPERFKHYAPVIADTFGNIYVNDHTREDIYHAPLLVAAEDVFPKPEDKFTMWRYIEECWVQMAWSASINPKGAFFCEVAAALSLLFDGPQGWPVEPGWWQRFPKDYTSQQEWACPKCGGAIPLGRRKSVDDRDDVSKSNKERLQGLRSFRERKGLLVDSDLKVIPDPQQMGAYKDLRWRNVVSHKFGLHLDVNEKGFNDPRLLRPEDLVQKRSLWDELTEQYGEPLPTHKGGDNEHKG